MSRLLLKSCIFNFYKKIQQLTRTEPLINLPHTEEQAEIIRKHDNILENMLRLEKDIDSQLLKAELNKQSILASAFSGRLLESYQRTEAKQYDEALGL